MSFWRKLFGGGKRKMVESAIAGLSKEWPELQFKVTDDGWALDISVVETGENVCVMSLATLDEYNKQFGADGVDRWLQDPQVTQMMGMASGRISPPDITVESLAVRLSCQSRFEGLEEIPPHRDVYPGVWGFVVSHFEEWGSRYVGQADLEDLGLDFDAGWKRALDNTQEALRGTQMQGIPDESGGLALMVVDHVHASASLLIPKFRNSLIEKLGEPFIACIPATDEVIAMPQNPRERAEQYLATARQTYQESAHPVSDSVLVVNADGVQPEA